jgi:hypothetical protein
MEVRSLRSRKIIEFGFGTVCNYLVCGEPGNVKYWFDWVKAFSFLLL